MKDYKVVNGTSYDVRTSDDVIRILENARQSRSRLHISYGECDGPHVGMDWLEECDIYGYIGRSTGSIKVPLLIANSRSMGGGAILDHCIVRIRHSAGGGVLYQHIAYHYGTIEIQANLNSVNVFRDGEAHASFACMSKARRWLKKLGIKGQ